MGKLPQKWTNLKTFWIPSKRTKIYFGKISTYACLQALKFRMQALFFMQIQNLKSDFRLFDFLLFLGIKSETNQSRSDSRDQTWTCYIDMVCCMWNCHVNYFVDLKLRFKFSLYLRFSKWSHDRSSHDHAPHMVKWSSIIHLRKSLIFYNNNIDTFH